MDKVFTKRSTSSSLQTSPFSLHLRTHLPCLSPHLTSFLFPLSSFLFPLSSFLSPLSSLLFPLFPTFPLPPSSLLTFSPSSLIAHSHLITRVLMFLGSLFKLWTVLIYILFPIPTLLLCLITLPLPSFCRRGVLWCIENISDFILFRRIFGVFNVWIICTILSALLVFVCANELQDPKYRVEYEESRAFRTQWVAGLGEKALRWRHERNLWISVFSLTLW